MQMESSMARRLIALVLCLSMVVGLFPGVSASTHPSAAKVLWEQVDNDLVSTSFLPDGFDQTREPAPYHEDQIVRVSIVLERQPTLSVYSGKGFFKNAQALIYRNLLILQQNILASRISQIALNDEQLDVVWNLTLAANSISANVPYGRVEAIKGVEGVADVFVETLYHPCVSSEDAHHTKMEVSTSMTGTTQAWSNGYTGAGTRIAIIDTGLDTEHQSVNDAAFQYSLTQLAQEDGMTLDAFVAQNDLLDVEEINSVLEQLNAYGRTWAAPASEFYRSSKIPFGFNYVDNSFEITHMHDHMGDHGSHVAGIAAANRFIPQADGSFAPAMEQVHMVGTAPDAQIIVMKVFGAGGGAYESDYMVAIEDAIILGCDTVNLSLGSSAPGLSTSDYYQDIMEALGRSETIATVAASNSSYWSKQAQTSTGLLYGEDVMFQTTSSPATFTNSLSVAAVDNDGMVGMGFYVTDRTGRFVTYNEPAGYNQNSFGSLDTTGTGTSYPFVWVDGIGQESDYTDIDLTGKVVFCSRGTTQFSEKATIAANRGAAAIVVYNNEAGSFNMNMADYAGSAPCISITRADGQAIRATAQNQGSHYTGTILITSTVSGNNWNSSHYVMSDSSSWGVPGDLSIKPEISAPGGNIWSLKGTVSTHDQYQVMGGTSMAAPHIAGIGALVMQAMEERGISQSELSIRALVQSLLMSTAVPMKDANGNYYPVFQQGAGLVDADAATSADSYLLVGGMEDGKVKVELGDDPGRTGEYTFLFTIQNLDNQTRSYTLHSDIFTQDTIQQNGFSWLELYTRPLNAATSTFAIFRTDNYDFDGNGIVEKIPDGQALLEYAAGHRSTIYHLEHADFNGDRQVTTYDAHLFLNQEIQDDRTIIPEHGTVEVPAGGSTDIMVTISLDSTEMAPILQHCPNGVYLQAYIYATPTADAEGAVGTTHSIPVLGFYGNWTDPSMYDKGSYQEEHYPVSGSTPYHSYLGSDDVNTFMVTYGGNNTIAYALGGNPVNLTDQYGAPAQLDRQYLPSRNALNNTNGDAVYSLRHAAIRNSVATRFTATDANTGQLYYQSEEKWNQYSAYYDPNAGNWFSTNYSPFIGWRGTNQYGEPLPEDTVVHIAYTRAPEYYVNSDGSIRWEDMGTGASFTTQVTIDNTAPRLVSAVAQNNGRTVDLTVKVHDNQYVAAVVLLDSLGERQLSFAGGNQMKKNIETDVVLYVDDVVGKSFVLQLYDYAMNVSTYQVTIEGMQSRISNYYTGYHTKERAWYGIDEDGTAGVHALDGRSIYAAERVGDFVFAVDSTQENTANLYVMPADDLAKIDKVGTIHAPHTGKTFYIADMAYHYPEKTMYFVYHSGEDGYGENYGLATLDLLTGQADFTTYDRPLGGNLRGLAIDEAGTFYGVGDNYQLYTYTKDTYHTVPTGGIPIDTLTGAPSRISLTWDAQKDELAMADHRSNGYTLYTVDETTGATKTVKTDTGTLWGLHVDSKLDHGQNFSETQIPTHVFFVESPVKMLLGSTYQLYATAYPWTLTDRSVTWSSNNNGIASVNQSGLVTGHSSGTCTITATSTLNPAVSATCEVEVTNIQADLTALVGRGGNNTQWSIFRTDTLPTYTEKQASAYNLMTAVYASDGQIYGATWDERAATSNLYRVDPTTLSESYVGAVQLRNYTYEVVDLADAPTLGSNLGRNQQYIVGVSNDNIMILDRTNGSIVGVIKSAMGLSSLLVGITYAGELNHPQKGVYDTYYAIDYYGKIYWVGIQVKEISGEGILTLDLLNRTPNYVVAETKLDTDAISFHNSLHYMEDKSGTPLLFWSYYRWSRPVQILAIDADKTGAMSYLGSFDRGIRPVGGLMDSSVPAFSKISAEQVTVSEGINDLEAFHANRGLPETAIPVRSSDGTLLLTSELSRHAADTPTDEKPTGDTSTDDKPAGGTPMDDKPADDTLINDKSGGTSKDNEPAADTPTDEKPTGDTSTDDKPAGGTPMDDSPTDDTPINDKSAGGTSTDDELADAGFKKVLSIHKASLPTIASLTSIQANVPAVDGNPSTGTGPTIDGEETGTGQDVIVTLTTRQSTTNGLLRVLYDPNYLTFVNGQGHTTLYSDQKESDGLITVGYANQNPVDAGNTLAQLFFITTDYDFETTVTVTVEEEGTQEPENAQLDIPIRREAVNVPPVQHSVVFDLNGGEGTVPAQTVEEGKPASEPARPVRTGYTFQHWSTSVDGSAYDFATPVTGALTLYTIWEKNVVTYTIQVDGDGVGGSITPNGTVTMQAGASQTITIRANAGYTIANVVIDGVSKGAIRSYTFENVTGNHTITVTFTRISSGGGSTGGGTAFYPTPIPGGAPSVVGKDLFAPFQDLEYNQWYSDYVWYMLDHQLMNGIASDLFSPNGVVTRGMLVTILYRMENQPNIDVTEIFDDVIPGAWYTDAVLWAANSGLVTGYDREHFGPSDPITREQLATILWRYAQFKKYDVHSKGTVMPNFLDREYISDYAGQAISWSHERGIINGRPGNLLDPGGSATRAEVCAMLVRFMRQYQQTDTI